jgi:hypothetical protein
MSGRSDRYRRLAQAVTDKIRSVPEERSPNASPCPGWTARDVVRHLVPTQGMFAGFVGLTLEPGPDVDADPLGAWTAASTQLQAHLDVPETADRQFQGFSGATTLAEAVDRFLCFRPHRARLGPVSRCRPRRAHRPRGARPAMGVRGGVRGPDPFRERIRSPRQCACRGVGAGQAAGTPRSRSAGRSRIAAAAMRR